MRSEKRIRALKAAMERTAKASDIARHEAAKAREKYDDAVDGPRARALVGKCFKYRNCYSCPEKQSDYWWMFARVVGSDSTNVRLTTAQIDKHGNPSMEQSARHVSGMTSYIPITKGEWRTAMAHILKQFGAKLEPPHD